MNRSPICLPLAGSLFALLTLAWGGPALAGFTANADGTVTDSVTGLVWDRCAWGQTWDGSTCTGSATTHAWPQALTLAATANGSSHRGRTDWRLPSRVELESLVDLSYAIPAIDITVFPNTPSSWVWSSTPFAFDPASAWFVDFGMGHTFAFPTNSSLHVRLVRSGQSFDLLSYNITTAANPTEGGSVTCTPNPVDHGSATTCTLTPADGFRAATAVGGTCPAGTWQDATTYRVEAITAACSVDFAFVLDGACGAADATATLTAPAGGLCAFGSPGPVTSADGIHAWSCAGDFGGNDAQCNAPGAAPGAYPGNTVTLEVEAGDGCTLDSAQLIDPPGSLPTGVELPYGAVDFTLSGCTSATVTLTHAGPVDTQAFWKYVHGRWVDRMPVTLSGNQVQFTLADGNYWDSDPRTGFIADPGGVGTPLAAVPALGPWALGLLAGLLGALGLRRRFPPRRRD